MPRPEVVEIFLRSANAADREFLWRLHKATMQEYVDETWGWEEEDQRRRFDDAFQPEAVMMIEVELRPVGYIRVERSPQEIFVHSIEVAPEFQNRGIATRLVRQLLDESEEKRIPIKLRVLKVNASARRLYERLGFRSVVETATHFIMKREV